MSTTTITARGTGTQRSFTLPATALVSDVTANGLRVPFVSGRLGEAVLVTAPAAGAVVALYVDLVPSPQPSFYAPLKTSVVPHRGDGAPSFTRATTATQQDHEGKLNAVLSGEARFTGARRVRNLCTNSYDFSGFTKNAAGTATFPTMTFGHEAPDGSMTAIRIVATCAAAAGDSAWVALAATTAATGTYARSLWIKDNGGTTKAVCLKQSSAGASDVVTVDGTWRRYSPANVTLAGPDSNALTCGLRGGVTPNGSIDILVWRPQFQEVTGQSNQNPSEYVSVGAPKLNELTFTEDFDNAIWAKTSCTVTANAATAPDGTMTADRLIPAAAVSVHHLQQNTLVTTSSQRSAVIYAKRESAIDKITLFPGASATFVHVNLTTQVIAGTEANVVSASITPYGTDGWVKISATWAAGLTSMDSLRIYASSGTNGASSAAGDGVSGVLLWRTQLNEGAAANPDFPVGNVYPFHGAMADGVKYFDYLNGNTVASNVVTEARGATIPAVTLKKYKAEGARTNLILNSVLAYTSGTAPNLFTAGFSTGTARGVAASTVVNGIGQAWQCSATNGREQFERSVSLAANSTYTVSLYVESVTGDTGVLSYASSVPAGAVSGNITSPSTPGRYSYTIVTSATAGTAVIRFGIGCSANNVGACTVRFSGINVELGGFASSYIPTTTAAVTRNADVLTYPFAGNASATSGAAYAELGTDWSSSPSAVALAFGSVEHPLWLTSGTLSSRISILDGVTSTTKLSLTDMATGVRKRASAWGGSTQEITGDGAAVSSGAFDGNIGSASIMVGHVNGAAQWFGNIGNVRIHTTKPRGSQLRELTA